MTREEAIKVANEMYGWLKTDREKEALKTLVPELLESEDERTREFLINFIKLENGANLSPDDAERCIAYLEKQKLSFKQISDGVIWDSGLRTGIELEKQQKPKPAHVDYVSGIRKELLGIEDNAKNIDGLTESQWVAIRAAHRLLGEYAEQEQKPAERVEINKSLTEAVIAELSKYNGENHCKSPWAVDSTGLQYPLYFANLGATWQKEQKPADIYGLRDWKFIVDAVLTEHEGIGQYLDKPETERIAKKLQERFSLPQSKPSEWNEEDEEHTNGILERLEGMCKKGATFTQTRFAVSEDEDWLKSLPKRFSFQPKQKWSENAWQRWSENAWQRLKTIAAKGYEEGADFIESIPPQEGIKGFKGDPDPAGVWKPSNGQLKALKYFLAHHRLQRDTSTIKWEEYDELQSLYDILCKIAK